MAEKYVAALCHPFDPEAQGAQVPDTWQFPTATAELHTSFTLQTVDTSGNLDFVMQPNPLCTIACTNMNGQVVAQGGTSWFATTGNTNVGATHGFSELGITSAATLANTFSRYRVVGFGCRLVSILPSLTQQGMIYVAKVPSLNKWTNYASYAGAVNASWANYLNFYGLPPLDSTNYITTQISQLQTFHENSVPNMTLAGGLEVVGSICSPRAFDFRDGSNVTQAVGNAGSFYYDGDSITGATNLIIATNGDDFIAQGGWSVLLFRATGLPTTANTKVFTLEVIMHIEGVPNLGTSVANSGTLPPVDLNLLNHAVHHASKIPHFRHMKHALSRARHTINHLFSDNKSQLATAALSMLV